MRWCTGLAGYAMPATPACKLATVLDTPFMTEVNGWSSVSPDKKGRGARRKRGSCRQVRNEGIKKAGHAQHQKEGGC